MNNTKKYETMNNLLPLIRNEVISFISKQAFPVKISAIEIRYICKVKYPEHLWNERIPAICNALRHFPNSEVCGENSSRNGFTVKIVA
jgi:hypothetical protein